MNPPLFDRQSVGRWELKNKGPSMDTVLPSVKVEPELARTDEFLAPADGHDPSPKQIVPDNDAIVAPPPQPIPGGLTPEEAMAAQEAAVEIIQPQTKYRIDPEFQSLMPAASSMDDQGLESDILSDGQIFDPLVFWINPEDGGIPIMLDGHRRLGIYHRIIERGITFPQPKFETIPLTDRIAAMQWIIRHQDGRRNWTAEQKAFAILRNTTLVAKAEADARARKTVAAKNGIPLGSDEPKGRVAEILAEMADISPATVKRAKANMKIIDASNNEEVKRQCYNPTTPEERLSFGEGVRKIRFGAKRDAVSKRNELSNDFVLEPLTPEQAGKLDTILLQDTITALKLIPSGTIDCIITSCPYYCPDIKYGNKESNTIMSSYKVYLNHLRVAFQEWMRVLKPGGRIFLNIDATNSRDKTTDKRHNIYADVSQLFKRVGARFYDDICWYKQQSAGRNGANFGSWASPKEPNLGRMHEYILIFYKETSSHVGNEDMNDISPKDFQDFRMSQWYIRPERRKDLDEGDYHPCPYPEELVYRILKLFTRIGDVILDPYCGSGTTLFVAKALRRRFIGIDNNPDYVIGANDWLATLDGKTNLEKEAAITRFRVPEGHRTDGYGMKPVKKSKAADAIAIVGNAPNEAAA